MANINILPYVYDYISVLLEADDVRKPLRKIILFGSYATGDFDEESDIDIFLDFHDGSDLNRIETLVRKWEKRFYAISSKKWELMGINAPVSSIIGNINDSKWEELKNEIISSGITLYGKFEELPKDLKQCHLFTYSLEKLKQDKKMKLIRVLFGYSTIGKTGRKGVIYATGGKKLGPNNVLVPAENTREIQKIFNSFGVTPEIREVWIR